MKMERFYNLIKNWYVNGVINTENFQEFCDAYLEEITKENEKVLDRLKNM